MEWEKIKGQKFELGRTINFALCNCVKCDFMNCPKNNYAVKMRIKKHTKEEAFEKFKDRILKLNQPKLWQCNVQDTLQFTLDYDLINDIAEYLNYSFPKGTYWSPEYCCNNIYDNVYRIISLQKFNRKGDPIELGRVYIENGNISDYDFSESQLKLARKLGETFKYFKAKVFEEVSKNNVNSLVGWLDTNGRHYVCKNGEHEILASYLGINGAELERLGWVHIVGEDDFFPGRLKLSAEQRNWLCKNGFEVQDYQ